MLWGVWDVNFRHLRFSALGFNMSYQNLEIWQLAEQLVIGIHIQGSVKSFMKKER